MPLFSFLSYSTTYSIYIQPFILPITTLLPYSLLTFHLFISILFSNVLNLLVLIIIYYSIHLLLLLNYTTSIIKPNSLPKTLNSLYSLLLNTPTFPTTSYPSYIHSYYHPILIQIILPTIPSYYILFSGLLSGFIIAS